MAKTRSIGSNAMKMLDRCSQPIYILDANQRLTFANQACADWIGLELMSLKNARCVYSASPLDDQIENAIRGLCPPASFLEVSPDAYEQLLEEQGDQFAIFSSRNAPSGEPQKASGELVWQQAIFRPLTDEQSRLSGVFIIASGIDCGSRSACMSGAATQANLVDGLNHSATLHQLLAEVESKAADEFRIQSLVGTSPAALLLRRQTQAAVESQADLLVMGPVGSGREHLARTIFHGRTSQQSQEPSDSSNSPGAPSRLIPIHCELADQPMIQNSIRQLGDREQNESNQDWLLLLNVEELAESAQAELLGFLQLPEFSIKTIATSQQSLIQLSRDGNFNLELAHRLSTTTIEVSPLTERTEDVPLLAQAILESGNQQRDIPMTGFSAAAMEMIAEFAWPENVDQMQRAIEQASEKATGKKITQTDLPDWFHQSVTAQRIGRSQTPELKLNEYLQEIEAELIRRALKWTKGNKSKASKMLGISRPKLLRRIQLLDLESTTGKPTTDERSETVDESAFEEAD